MGNFATEPNGQLLTDKFKVEKGMLEPPQPKPQKSIKIDKDFGMNL